MEKTVKEGTVFEKKVPQVFINGENAVAVDNINEFEGHGGGALHGIKISAGRAETAVTTERDKFEFATAGTAVHGTAKGGITAVDHLVHIFNHRGARMQCIKHFFIMFGKDFL